MTKNEQRQDKLRQLKEFPKTEKAQADRRLLEKVLTSPAYRRAKTIATYLNLPHEVATSQLIEQALVDGKRVVVPKVISPNQMIFVAYDPDALETAAFGILQPIRSRPIPKTSIDLIHVPGLVFDRRGYRIGYGGGYYDRYLADFQGETLATAYSFQLASLDPSPHDIPVKELLLDEPTPTKP